jgi:hypothetical protein
VAYSAGITWYEQDLTIHKPKVGNWFEVRSKEEILRTLDANGQLDGMPFMPEMLAFCGQRFQVYKRAHKTCDTVFPVRGRRVEDSVHFDTRCDGSAHGGCQAGCLIFWKLAWLKRVADGRPTAEGLSSQAVACSSSDCKEPSLLARTQTVDSTGDDPSYVCQATQLPYATSNLNWWDIRQYIEDYRSGNVGLWRIICGAAYFSFLGITEVIGGPTLRHLYDKVRALWGGTPFPRKTGSIPHGQSTPVATLDLQPGELVRIKPHDEILKTLDANSRNRGLYFDAEEVPYCGETHRVLRRVDRIVNERTGKMREMKTPCVILDSVFCESRYSECRLFCPRSIYAYWREAWLERVGPPPAGISSAPEASEAVTQETRS